MTRTGGIEWRWPIVARSTFELARAQADAWEARYDRLLSDTLALKREGFVAPAPTEAAQPDPPLPVAVDELLDDLMLPPKERARTERRARELLAEGKHPTSVINALIEG